MRLSSNALRSGIGTFWVPNSGLPRSATVSARHRPGSSPHSPSGVLLPTPVRVLLPGFGHHPLDTRGRRRFGGVAAPLPIAHLVRVAGRRRTRSLPRTPAAATAPGLEEYVCARRRWRTVSVSVFCSRAAGRSSPPAVGGVQGHPRPHRHRPHRRRSARAFHQQAAPVEHPGITLTCFIRSLGFFDGVPHQVGRVPLPPGPLHVGHLDGGDEPVAEQLAGTASPAPGRALVRVTLLCSPAPSTRHTTRADQQRGRARPARWPARTGGGRRCGRTCSPGRCPPRPA